MASSNEWMTPRYIVDPARKILRCIDLDPASSWLGNEVVSANHFFGSHVDGGFVDGLSRNWYGRVFLNPPGGKVKGKSSQSIWWKKLLEEWLNNRVKQAIYVGFSMSVLRHGQHMGVGPLRFPLCIPKDRIPFDQPSKVSADGLGPHSEAVRLPSGSPRYDNVVVYLPPIEDAARVFIPNIEWKADDNCRHFSRVFSNIGEVRL